MKAFTDDELKARLLEDDYPNDERLINGVIEKIRNFGNEAQAMFEDWYNNGKISKFDINGITPAFLREHHKMKDAGIIIALDWLSKQPEEAARLLKRPLM